MSTNQSFVGAYARRHRSARLADTNQTSQAVSHADQPSASDQLHAASEESDAVSPAIESPQINVYPVPRGRAQESVSVQHTASATESMPQKTVWIDGSEGQIYRVDTPETESVGGETAEKGSPGGEVSDSDLPGGAPSTIEPARVPEIEAPTDHESAGVQATAVELETASDLETASLDSPSPFVEQSPEPAMVPSQSKWTGARWEVDGFAVPSSVADLFFDEAFFQSIAGHMHESVRSGLRSMMVTSIGSQAGRSTVAIGTAIAAAASGLSVALVDLDLESPDLADVLRLDTQADWVAAIRHDESLETISIASIEDNITLVPLSDNESRTLPITSLEIDQLLDRLGDCFDLVVFDGPTTGAWSTARIAANVDSCLIVRDARANEPSDIEHAAQRLRRQGVQGIGVVDNFCR